MHQSIKMVGLMGELLRGPAGEGLNPLTHVEQPIHGAIPLPHHLLEGIGEAGELGKGSLGHPPQGHQFGHLREGHDHPAAATIPFLEGQNLHQVSHLAAGNLEGAPRRFPGQHGPQGPGKIGQGNGRGHPLQGLTDVGLHQPEHPHGQGREATDEKLPVEDHHALAEGGLDVLQLVVEPFELFASTA